MSYGIMRADRSDIPGIIEVEKSAWSDLAATAEMFESRIATFSDGVLIAKEGTGQVVGVVVVCIRDYDEATIHNSQKIAPTWAEATGDGMIMPVHNITGNVVYGTDLSVHQRYWSKGVGEALVRAGSEHVGIPYNKKYGLIGARMPGFGAYADRMTPEAYIRATRSEGIPLDDELAFFLSIEYGGNHWQIARLLPNYFPDQASLNYGVLLAWENPFYRP